MLKLFKYLKPYTFHIAAVLVLVFFQTLSDLYLPTLMSDIINKGVMQGDTGYIWRTGSLMLLIAGGGAVLAVVASYLSAISAMGLGRILREKVFGRVESFSLHEFDKIGTSTLITRTTNDITQVQMVTMMMMRMMIGAPMMAIGGTIMALRKDNWLTLVLVVAIPILFAIIGIIGGRMIPLFKAVQFKIDRLNLVLREKLTGVRVIRAFNTEDREKARFEEANADLTVNYIKVNKIMAFMMPAIMLTMNLTMLAITWFGALRIDAGSMDLGSLMAFTQYAMQIMFSMIMLSVMFIMVPRAQASAKRINEVLETEPTINDRADINSCPVGKGHLEFRDVSYSYHGAEEPAIRNISFKAEPGEVTAIIGSTGSGKSTVVNLIPRFYDVSEGAILIDGEDIREMTQECVRAKVGLVPQNAILFSGTIAENIKFGLENATDEEIRRAAEIAQASEFIETMEDGYDHKIAQGGTNVSGGQKQRLSIARALVRRPEIYIFDDCLSALDFKTDSKLRAALRQEIGESTLIIVAQRVGTVMDADRIIVLDEGTVAGIGTHKELIESCPVYKEIALSQLSEEEIA